MFIYHAIQLIIMCDENQAIDNRIIPPYVTGALKHSMHVT